MRSFRAAVWLAVLIAITAVACATGGGSATSAGRHLVLVSIDALRPEFYLDPSYPAPTLRALVARGAHAVAVEPVYPSVTYPNHSSIVTGVRPATHGVPFNTMFDPTGARGRWYDEASDLHATPLWEWARAAGLTTAGVSWPVTGHARMDVLLAERDYYARAEPLAAMAESITPGLFERTRVSPDPAIFKDVTLWDDFLARTAVAIIGDARPNLVLLHLAQVDLTQHQGGRNAPGLRAAVGRVDAHLAAVLRAVDAAGLTSRTVILVTGDHGFQDYSRIVFPNVVLARAGLRGCPRPGDDWRASAHATGASAAVFVSAAGGADAATAADRALREHAAGRYTIVPRAELDRLGAMPGAAFALDAEPGWAIQGGCGDSETRAGLGGVHGALPSRPTMATGFVAAGLGVRSGVTVDRMRVIDVAPTAARLLGVTAPAVEGRVLDEMLVR